MAMTEELAPENVGGLLDAGGAPLTDHHAEGQLVGYLLARREAITETVEILHPSDLHDPFHRRVYEQLLHSYESGTPFVIDSGIGGKMIGRLIVDADLSIDLAETADYLQSLGERRATGTADDVDYAGGEPFTSKFGAQVWEDIGTGEGPLYEWLIEDAVPLAEIVMAYGDSGTGKSFAMFDMAMCVARNIPFNGRNVEPGLVIYVAAEAGKGFVKRKVAYVIQHGLEASEPLPFVLLTKRPNLFLDDTDVLALIREITAIKKRYSKRLVLIIIDTLSASTSGMDEISGRDQSMVRRRFKLLEEQFGATVVVVHHKPKNGSGPRGHGSLTADIETTIDFETVNDKKTSTGKTIHRATVRKQREGKASISWEFTLPVVEVGRNKWGNPETSCVVQSYATSAPKAGSIGFHATATEMLFMRALYDSISERPLPPPMGLPKSITKVTEIKVVRALARERTIAAHEDDEIADGRFRVAFKRAGDKLRDGAVIGVQGGLIWPTGKPVNGFAGPIPEGAG